MKVLTEAAGSPVWGTLLPYLHDAGLHPVMTDIAPLAAGLYLGGTGYLVPKVTADDYFPVVEEIVRREGVELVLPSLNEGLLAWAERREAFAAIGATVLLAHPSVIRVFVDKWETYRFFQQHEIPTPATSLTPDYELIKPRIGRGGSGIRRRVSGAAVDMAGYVSQQYVEGQEYTIDALCDQAGNALYVVPRKRLAVESGLSVKGQVVRDDEIESYVWHILAHTQLVGPVNLQCFRTPEGRVLFTEVNPRLAGGLSLSMAATENWFAVLRRILEGRPVQPRPIRAGLVMLRYLADYIVEEQDLLASGGHGPRRA